MLNASGVATGSVPWRSYMTPVRRAVDSVTPQVAATITFSSSLGPRSLDSVDVSNATGGACGAPLCAPVAVGGNVSAGQVVTCTFNCSQATQSVNPAVVINGFLITTQLAVTNLTMDGETACALLTAPSTTNYQASRRVCTWWHARVLFWPSTRL